MSRQHAATTTTFDHNIDPGLSFKLSVVCLGSFVMDRTSL